MMFELQREAHPAPRLDDRSMESGGQTLNPHYELGFFADLWHVR